MNVTYWNDSNVAIKLVIKFIKKDYAFIEISNFVNYFRKWNIHSSRKIKLFEFLMKLENEKIIHIETFEYFIKIMNTSWILTALLLIRTGSSKIILFS